MSASSAASTGLSAARTYNAPCGKRSQLSKRGPAPDFTSPTTKCVTARASLPSRHVRGSEPSTSPSRTVWLSSSGISPLHRTPTLARKRPSHSRMEAGGSQSESAPVGMLSAGTTSEPTAPAQPREPAKQVASVQLLVTGEMQEELKVLGYTDEDIATIRPELAASVISKELGRPWGSSPMPDQWKRMGWDAADPPEDIVTEEETPPSWFDQQLRKFFFSQDSTQEPSNVFQYLARYAVLLSAGLVLACIGFYLGFVA